MRAVLFDFGGVILTSPFEAFAEYEHEHQLPQGFLRALNAANPDRNAWARLERGELGLDVFAVEFEREAAAAGHQVNALEVLARTHGTIRPEMVETLVEVRRRGLLTALCTNNSVAGAGFGDLLHLFDAVVESVVVGVRKPEPAFYRIVLDRLGVAPTACVFLDDLGVNLKPAAAMGMTTIKVVDPADAIARLWAVLDDPMRHG